MSGLITLSHSALQLAKTDVIAYGAKDTGEMGGGAAAEILKAAGEGLLDALKAELAKTSRRVGEVAVTESFGLKSRGIRWICHIISIIRNTPQGAWCPEPARLADGVSRALELSRSLGAHSITLSALGTGEGRVDFNECARLMMGAAKDFSSKNRDYFLDIEFALPNFRDFEAFEKIRKTWR